MSSVPRPRQPGELVFACLLLLFSLFVFAEAYKISGFSSVSSAGVFPMGAAAIMILAALVIIVSTYRQSASLREPGSSAFRKLFQRIVPADVIVFTTLLIAYTMALDALGFFLSSFLFLFISIAYLYRRSLMLAFVISAGSLVLIYVVFRVIFTLVLPKGWIFQ